MIANLTVVKITSSRQSLRIWTVQATNIWKLQSCYPSSTQLMNMKSLSIPTRMFTWTNTWPTKSCSKTSTPSKIFSQSLIKMLLHIKSHHLTWWRKRRRIAQRFPSIDSHPDLSCLAMMMISRVAIDLLIQLSGQEMVKTLHRRRVILKVSLILWLLCRQWWPSQCLTLWTTVNQQPNSKEGRWSWRRETT